MDFRRVLALLARWWWLLALATLLAGVCGYVVGRSLPRVYRASTLLFVNYLAVPGPLTYSDLLLNQQLVKTYSQLVLQPVVLDEAQRRVGEPVDAAAVAAQPVRDTLLMEISVQDRDAARARDIANTIAAVFVAQQAEFLPTGQQESALRIAQPALLPAESATGQVIIQTVLAALLGLLVGLAGLVLVEHLDDVARTPKALDPALLSTLGTIARVPSNSERLLWSRDGKNQLTEMYRFLRTSLNFAGMDGPVRSVLVTSAGPREGKSTITVNLATVLARAGKRVIAVDTDLRRPTLHELLNVSGKPGLTDLLLQDLSPGTQLPAPTEVVEFLKPTEVDGLWLMPAGAQVDDPDELLASPQFEWLLTVLRSKADVVLLDSPPVLAFADATVLATNVDGVMLVVDAERTRVGMVHQANEALRRTGTRQLGAVLNKVSGGVDPYTIYSK